VYLYADTDEDGSGTLTRNIAGGASVVSSGNLVLKSAADLTLSTILNTDELDGTDASGRLYFYTTTDASTITIDSSIDRNNKNLYFCSDGNLTQNAATTLDAGTGRVYLYADTDEDGSGTLTRNIAGGASVINSGDFTLQSASDLILSTLLNTNELDGTDASGILRVYSINNAITIDSDVTRSNKGALFYADGNLTQNAATTLDAGTGGVYPYADTDNNGSGTLTRNIAGGASVINSGNFRLKSASDLTLSTILGANELDGTDTSGVLYFYTTADASTITIDSNFDRNGKSVSFNAYGNLTQNLPRRLYYELVCLNRFHHNQH